MQPQALVAMEDDGAISIYPLQIKLNTLRILKMKILKNIKVATCPATVHHHVWKSWIRLTKNKTTYQKHYITLSQGNHEKSLVPKKNRIKPKRQTMMTLVQLHTNRKSYCSLQSPMPNENHTFPYCTKITKPCKISTQKNSLCRARDCIEFLKFAFFPTTKSLCNFWAKRNDQIVIVYGRRIETEEKFQFWKVCILYFHKNKR